MEQSAVKAHARLLPALPPERDIREESILRPGEDGLEDFGTVRARPPLRRGCYDFLMNVHR